MRRAKLTINRPMRGSREAIVYRWWLRGVAEDRRVTRSEIMARVYERLSSRVPWFINKERFESHFNRRWSNCPRVPRNSGVGHGFVLHFRQEGVFGFQDDDEILWNWRYNKVGKDGENSPVTFKPCNICGDIGCREFSFRHSCSNPHCLEITEWSMRSSKERLGISSMCIGPELVARYIQYTTKAMRKGIPV